ncbi:hypothetical protein Cgig2_011377 [Carnegiea gigantea]|uniref:FAS1 domain-containing protein n=1 Tax=Carnegiea gigantea TaxID=171969 RepID=A0A9Q1QP95_9CARY|nr:hypothetical protein Cgig2_011377 [Carnegiea gigantea]
MWDQIQSPSYLLFFELKMTSWEYNCILILSIILISATTIRAFNITRLLDNHPDFSTFNSLLSKTGVANGINSRQTITVLVVENSGMSSVTNKAESTVRYILAGHVILDYYDELKLANLQKNKSGTIVTTLLQATGVAQNRQGFLNITVSDKDVVFGSTVTGAQHDSKMVKVVAAQPHNISVIQISQPIIPPGLDGFSNLPPSTSPMTFDDAPVAPSPKKGKKENPSDEEGSDDADAPSDDTDDDKDADADEESPSDEDKDSKGADGGHGGNDKYHMKNAGAKVVVHGGAMLGVCMALLGLLL